MSESQKVIDFCHVLKKKVLSIAVVFILTLHFLSCDDIDIMSPAGPAGMSAYEVWVQGVKNGDVQWTSDTDLANFFKYMQGENANSDNAYEVWKEYIKTGTVSDPHKPGSKWSPSKNSMADYYYFLSGAKGDDAVTPHVNGAGNWQIGDTDTGIPAKGQDGQNGVDGSVVIIGANGNWFINGVDSRIPAKGKDGSVIIIGANNNWFINGVDTGILAKGQDGQNGQNGQDGVDGSVVTIDLASNNWFIDGVDTGILANGQNGTNGKSAFEMWKEEVDAGNITDKDGNIWLGSNISLGDFWNYLSGESATPKGVTPLNFIASYLDPNDIEKHIFKFQTDPGAKVTMNYGGITISGIADASGECIIKLGNSNTGSIPVLAFAELAGVKSVSSSVLLSIPVRPAAFRIGDVANWYGYVPGAAPLVSGNGVQTEGSYDINSNPRYISLIQSQGAASVEVEFEAENIQDVVVLGGTTSNFILTVVWNAQRTGGVLKITRPNGTWTPEIGGLLVSLQMVGNNGVASFYQIIVETKN